MFCFFGYFLSFLLCLFGFFLCFLFQLFKVDKGESWSLGGLNELSAPF
jgi:hypothetical protein